MTLNLSEAKNHDCRHHPRGSVRRASGFVLTGKPEENFDSARSQPLNAVVVRRPETPISGAMPDTGQILALAEPIGLDSVGPRGFVGGVHRAPGLWQAHLPLSRERCPVTHEAAGLSRIAPDISLTWVKTYLRRNLCRLLPHVFWLQLRWLG